MMICSAVGAGEMDVKFEAIGETYLEELLRSSPVAATGMGDHRFDSLLDEVALKFRPPSRTIDPIIFIFVLIPHRLEIYIFQVSAH